MSSLRVPIVPQNISRTFFILCFVSTIFTQILLLWKMLKKHWRLKNILLLGITWIYWVAIYGRRINSDRKKVFFFTKKSFTAIEKNSFKWEDILLTLFTNTSWVYMLRYPSFHLSVCLFVPSPEFLGYKSFESWREESLSHTDKAFYFKLCFFCCFYNILAMFNRILRLLTSGGRRLRETWDGPIRNCLCILGGPIGSRLWTVGRPIQNRLCILGIQK